MLLILSRKKNSQSCISVIEKSLLVWQNFQGFIITGEKEHWVKIGG